MAKSRNWFDVDRDGLREIHGALPCERMVVELIQNSLDEKSSRCDAVIERESSFRSRTATRLVVTDDNPDGFRNLADAYTLFRTTPKRSDPTKRGRFNYGEKLVLSRALSARITSTTGEIRFDEDGRHHGRSRRAAGTAVEFFFPRWTKAQYDQAIAFLRRVMPPAGIVFTLNGEVITARTPEKVHPTQLTTEVLKDNGEGAAVMTRVSRNTQLEFFPMVGPKAVLFEMGIPVCEISGDRDINVLQKVPLSQDRTTVAEAFMQDLYAETVRALIGSIDVNRFGVEVIQSALADDRVDALTAKTVFTAVYGEKAAIQSHDPDSDQEAARAGYSLVPPRTWGKVVNDKFRDAGVSTTKQLFGRSGIPEFAREMPPAQYTPQQAAFVAYVQMHARHQYGANNFTVQLGRWDKSKAIAFNQGRSLVMFHADRVDIAHPVSKATSTVLHELAHCMGTGHDGVYDFEYERLVDAHTVLLARRPDLYRPFEPELFPGTAAA